MDEHEWMTCTDPEPMLRILRKSRKVSRRQLRLFAVACCRVVWHVFKDQRSRQAIDIAERWADGRATRDELRAAQEEARVAVVSLPSGSRKTGAPSAAYATVAYAHANEMVCRVRAFLRPVITGMTVDAESALHASLLRDIVGPVAFREPAKVEPALLDWNDGLVKRLAEAVYQERRPDGTLDADRLAVLSDALEEAGCQDAELLEHLRSPGPHVCGCWAVDTLLGKS